MTIAAIRNALRIAVSRTERNPSDAQKESGNYPKGKLAYKGLTIAIENPKGSERSGVGKDGKRWAVRMPASYGYILGSEGKDGDHVDVYLGPDHGSDKVFVVDQINAESGRFDEHKAMLSYAGKSAALADYEQAFSDGKAKDRIGAVTEMGIDAFKAWVRSGDTKKPVGSIRKGYATGGTVEMPIKSDKKSISLALDVARRSRQKKAGGGAVTGYADGGEATNLFEGVPYTVIPGFNDVSTGDIRDEAAYQAKHDRPLGIPPHLEGHIRDAHRGEGAFAEPYRGNSLPGIMAPFVDAASLGAELTGIPSMIRGYGNVRRGLDEGDALRGVGGAGEMALGAIPGASVLRGPTRALVEAIMPTLPRAIATTTGLALPSAIADDAEAAEKGAAAVIESDPEVRSLRADLDNLTAERLRASSSPIKGLNKASADEARQRADANYGELIEVVQGKLEAAESRARENYIKNAPFRERYPGAALSILGGGMLGAAGLGGAKGFARALGDAARGRRIDGATDKVDAELAALARGTDDASSHGAASAQELLRRRVGDWDRKHSPIERGYQSAGNVAKGAIIGAEASAAPEQIDYVTFDPGHPSRERAVELFTKPGYWAERAIPAATGASAAHLGHAVGKGAGQVATGGAKPDLERARLAASWGDEPSTTQKLLGMMPGARSPMGPSELALARIKRHQEAIADTEGATLSAADRARQVREAGRETALDARETALDARETAQGLDRNARLRLEDRHRSDASRGAPDQSAAAPRSRPPLPDEPSPNPSSSPSSSLPEYSPTGLGRQVPPPALPSPDAPKLMPGVGLNSRGLPYDLHTGHIIKKRLNTPRKEKDTGKSSKSDEEKRRGGAVGAALDTARRYAQGGAVVVGEVIGPTRGREDAKPVDVPGGSYVIPADVVSALGEGNSLAGCEHLKKTFGAPTTRAAGGAIPIRISDGEYVLSPDQVAKIGGGDLDRGHRTLDALMLKLRQQHIETLKALPGPAKG